MLRWRVFILKIANPVMAQCNKGHKYMINFKLVNGPSRFLLKPAHVSVIRNFICSLQRYRESLMLQKNELMLKKGEKNLCLSINMMRIHVWKAKNNVLRGSIVIPFYQSAAPFVSFPLRWIHSSLLLLFQNKRQSDPGSDLLEIHIFDLFLYFYQFVSFESRSLILPLPHRHVVKLWCEEIYEKETRFIRGGFQCLQHMDSVRNGGSILTGTAEKSREFTKNHLCPFMADSP